MKAPFAVLLPFEIKRTRYAAGPGSLRVLRVAGVAGVLVAGSALGADPRRPAAAAGGDS